MKVLFIELCNYIDYPTGGHLSFALHMLGAFGTDLKLVGINTDKELPVGVWIKYEIDGVDYDFFNVGNVKRNPRKPILPSRITNFLLLKKNIRKILETDYDRIVIQTPEVLFALPLIVLEKVTLIMPGIENPIKFSRYKFVRCFATLYDNVFFRRITNVSSILPAADQNAIQDFIKRSKGLVNSAVVRQFPTRYDSKVFYIRDSKNLRSVYGIEENIILYVTVGRLNWIKGWQLIIDSFSILNTPNAHLFFIGDGEDEYKIKEYIIHKGLEDQVFLLGKKSLSIISDYLNMADAFLMASYKEGWSTSLVEAVACGCPCVVTDFSSARDMVTDGKNGWVIKGRSEEEYAKRMNDVLLLDKANLMDKALEISFLSVQNMRKQMSLSAGWVID